MVYDPDHDPEQKRALRKQYRGLNQDEHGNTIKTSDVTTEQLLERVHRSDQLFQQVLAPQEATLDSNFLLTASNMGAAKARAMKAGGSAFDVDDFISKLITYMGGRTANGDDSDEENPEASAGPLDWEKIGRKALAKSRRVPAMDFMLGPLLIEQKKRAVGKRAKLEKNKEDERKPQEVKEDDIQRSENETTKHVITIRELLEGEGAINLFEFIINPHDFAQSVENLFYLSFLIRDGVCALQIDAESEWEPRIYICEAPSQSDYDEGLKKQQLVLELDMETWETAIREFNITAPKIPQRPKSKENIGNKWYG
ncbi:Nse4 C-terminal-domain-containing protein [Amylostereum chailletii]|nr:Nse4 C-terminal-domain-containing protein [Amylostereum chailletii]